MRAVLGATVLATATAGCGAKHDPYAASLAKGSEHVEIRGVVNGHALRAAGDFHGANGTMTIRSGKVVVHEVISGSHVFVDAGRKWSTATTTGFVSPVQIFRKRLPATIANGLVERVVLRTKQGRETIAFSKYGEHVSVTVPRVKGAAG